MFDPVDPIVEALRQERLRRNWSQRYVAELVGMRSCMAVAHWELADSSPSVPNLRRWADALGFDLVLKERG